MTSVHFTETCEADAPHLIVEVTPTSATTADGDIVGELHEQLAEQQLLPSQHLMDMGYVDAEVLAESQRRYQVDIVGPVMPDTSWSSQEADRFDHSHFFIDWQAKRVVCPAGQTSRDWGHIPDRHRKPTRHDSAQDAAAAGDERGPPVKIEKFADIHDEPPFSPSMIALKGRR